MNFLQIAVGDDGLTLHGAGKAGVLRGCLRRPTEAINTECCREQLDLILEGSKTSTQHFISALQILLTKIQAGQPAVLRIQPDADSVLYESRLLSGQFTWLVGSVQPRGVGLRLELERCNYWELPWVGLPLANGYGKETLLPLRIDNRADQLGENQVFCGAEALPGDLPAPLRLLVWNDQGDAAAIQHFYADLSYGERRAWALEGEDALADPTIGVVIDAASQGGAYALKQGSGPQPVCLLRWQIDARDWKDQAGKSVLPVARLKSLAPADLWVWWQVYQGGLVEVSLEERMLEDRLLVPLPTFHFPLLLDGAQEAGGVLRLELWGQIADGEAFTLALDAVQLLDGGGWMKAVPLPEGTLFPGEILVLDSRSAGGWCRSIEDQAQRYSHQVTGTGLWLLPKQAARCGFVFDEASGCFPAKRVRVQLQVRPRVRVMP